MSERNVTPKQPKSGKKPLLIVLAAVLVVVLVLLCVLLVRCDGTGSTPTEPTTDPAVTDTTAPEEELLTFPCKIWDMEKLPESLVDAGMAYANSNDNIYGNVILGGVDGKGVAKSRAFGYTFEGDYSDGDLFVMSPNSLKEAGFPSNWTGAEMLWIWVGGSELLQNVRLEIIINGNYMPIDSVYYTVNEAGECVEAGTIPIAWGSTTKRGRIRLDAGWEGWIGLPLSIYNNPEKISSIQFIVGNSTVKAGNVLYLDEFWLTKMGEVPALSAEQLQYKALSNLELGQIWDAEQTETGDPAATVGVNDTRGDAHSLVTEGNGVLKSKALAYVIDQTTKTNTENMDIQFNALLKKGANLRAINDPSNILWFWVDSELSSTQLVHLQLNGVFLDDGKSVYTIKDVNGKPQLTEVPYQQAKGSVNGMSIVPYNGTTSGKYARIELSPGWSGWIGIPVGNFCVNSDGTAAAVPNAMVSKLTVRLFGDQNSLQKGDTLYFDEFWITEAGQMPGLSDEALVYGYSVSYTRPVVYYGRIWNADNVSSGRQVGNLGTDVTRNTVTTAVTSGKGVSGTKALAYIQKSVGNTNGNNMELVTADLESVSFKTAITSSQSDLLWFWVDSATDHDQLLHVQVNGRLMDKTSIYTIVEKDGKATIVEVPYTSNGALVSTGMGLVPSGGKKDADATYARIKLCDGWSGWIGIPVDNFSLNSDGTRAEGKVERIIKYQIRNFVTNGSVLTTGDALYFDEFWLTKAGNMPELTTAQLLYGYTAPEEVSDSGQIWNAEHADLTTNGQIISGMVATNADRAGATAGVYQQMGVTGSNALGYRLTSVNKSQSNQMTVSGDYLSKYGYNAAAIGSGDVLWFWVYADVSTDQLLHVHLNDHKVFPATEKGVYTIGTDDSGNPVREDVAWYGTSASVPAGQLGVVYSNGTTASGYARILVRAGWSGWIGIPVENFCVDSSGKAASVPVGTVEQMMFRLYGANNLAVGDTVYFDEFCLADSGKLPDVSKEALLYTYQAPAPSEDLQVNGRYENGMIFQHGKPWQVHGTGKAGETVTVELLDAANAVKQTATATVAADGTWKVLMNAVDGSYDVYCVKVFCGEASETFTDVVFGEVWITSGQSNMFYTISQTNDPMFDANQDVAALKTRLEANEKASFIRMYLQGTPTADFGGEHTDPNGRWTNASVWGDVEATSAVAMYFIEQLHGKLDMPVGVVVAARGGTSIATWVDTDVIGQEKYADFNALCAELGYFTTASAQYHVAGYFNSTVAPFQGYEAAGLLWYQGEQDRSTPEMQNLGFEVLVESYSKVFTTSETPSETGLDVIAMQIAPFIGYINSSNVYPDANLMINSGLNAGMRAGAAKVQAKGGNVVLIPIYDLDAIVDDHHPLNKKDVANRIMQVALETYYDSTAGNEVYSGPAVTAIEYLEGKVLLTFDQKIQCIPLTQENNQRITKNGIYVLPAESELYSTALNGFSVFTGTAYISVDAVIVGDNQVELTVPANTVVGGVCYAYGLETLSANLYDADGLPALPFYLEREGFKVTHQSLLWSADEVAAQVINGNNAGSATQAPVRNTSKISIAAGEGLLGTQALKYELMETGMDRTHTWNCNNPDTYGFRTTVASASDEDILWFWVHANLSTKQRLQFSVNNQSMQSTAGLYIYTIVENAETGKPEMSKIFYAAADNADAPVDYVPHSTTQAQILFDPGWSGWIGIPMSDFAGSQKAGTMITQIGVLLLQKAADGDAYADQKLGDAIILDEFWLTSPEMMPDLSDEALLYKVSTTAPVQELKLNGRYESGMIFQQNKPFTIHGSGIDGQTVTVTLLKGTETAQTATATVENGAWSVSLSGVAGSYDAYTVKVSDGTTELTVEDIVFGEVWVVGGQSNMAYAVSAITSTEQQTALQASLAANDKASYIRFYTQAAAHGIGGALTAPVGAWGSADVWSEVLQTSGTGIYFAEAMQAKLNVPVGFVVAAEGGTGLTAWVNADIAATYEDYIAIVKAKGYDKATASENDYLSGWYNSRVAPWSGYEVSGMLWYQGEHERSGNSAIQTLGMPVLMETWSKVFNSESAVDQLPLVAIQIAPYATASSDTTMINNYTLNAAMRAGVEEVAKTGKAVCVSQYDLYVTVNDIHPRNKPELGARCADVAYALVYTAADDLYVGPTVQDVTFADGTITITFTNVGEGLKYIQLSETDNYRVLDTGHTVDITDFFVDKLNGFSVKMNNQVVSVDAAIVGTNQVQITVPAGTAVEGVYYGFGHEILSANLFGSAGLPAEPFYYENSAFVPADHQTKIWDVEHSGLTDGLTLDITTSNSTSWTDVSSKVSAGNGVSGSKALAYAMVTINNNQSKTIGITADALADYGFNSASMRESDILWFWVDSDLSVDRLLHVQLNNSFQGLHSIYTIVDVEGVPTIKELAYDQTGLTSGDGLAVVASGGAGHTDSTTYSRIRLDAGWSGWIGIAVSSFDGNGSTVPSGNVTTIHFRLAGAQSQAVGETVYFDEFWLTSAGKMPDLTTEQLLYKAEAEETPEPDPEPTGHQTAIWNQESNTSDPSVTRTHASRNDSLTTVSTGTGVGGSKALKFEATEAGTITTAASATASYARSITQTLSNLAWATYGGVNATVQAADDIFWMWIDADLSTAQRFTFQLEGKDILIQPEGEETYIYTITDVDDVPTITKILYSADRTAPVDTVAGIDLINENPNTNQGTKAQILLSDGFSGWIGLPLDMLNGTLTELTKFSLLLNQYECDDPIANQQVGDAVYMDEFWLTSAGKMPDLTSDQLLYKAEAQVTPDPDPEPTAQQILLQNFDALTAGDAVGTMQGTTAKNYGPASAAVSAANGISNSQSMAYTIESADYNQNQNVQLDDELAAHTVQDGTDILWFWVDSDLTNERLLHVQINGTLLKQQSIYTIVSDNGTPKIASVEYVDDRAAVETMAPVNSNWTLGGTYARIKLPIGWNGWIGIPMANVDITSGTIEKIQLRVYGDRNLAPVTVGEVVYMDQFWLTSANTMPDLTDAELLYNGDPATPSPEPEPEEAPESLSVVTFADGASVSDLTGLSYIAGTTNKSTFAITDGKGLGGKSAMTITIKPDAGDNQVSDWWYVELSSMPDTVATVNTQKFTDIMPGVSTSDMMLWFYIDGTALTEDARLSFGMRDPSSDNLNAGSNWQYTFEKQYYIDAFGDVHSMYLGANGTGAGLISSDARGRTTVEAGTAVWIGIPVDSFGNSNLLTCLGDIRFSLHRGVDRDNGNVQTNIYGGNAVSIGDIWLTRKDADGNWIIPEPAEEGLLDKNYYTAEDYLANPSLFTPAWKGQFTVPAELLDWEEKFQSFYTPNGRTMSVAHRGDRNVYYPENSIEGFMSVIAAGVDIIEVDVIKTKDGIPVAFHGSGTNNNELLSTTNLSQLRAQGKAYHLPSSNVLTDWTLDELRQLRLVLNGKVTGYVIPTIEDVIMVAKNNVFINLDKWTRYDWDADILPLIQKTGAYETVLLSQSYNENKGYQYTKDRIDQLVSLGARKAGVMSEPWSTSVDTVVSNIATYGLPKILRLHEFKIYTTQYGGDEYELAKQYVGTYRIYLETLNSSQDNETTWAEIVEYGGNIIMSNKYPYQLVQFIIKTHFTEEEPAAKQTLLESFDALTAGASVGEVSGSSYSVVNATVSNGGINASNAVNYTITSTSKNNNSQNLDLTFTETAAEADDILWFWVDSDMEEDRLLHVQLNDSHLAPDFIYTIADVSGVPTIQKVTFSDGTTEGDGLALVASGGTGGATAAYARIRLDSGWYGWIGIPVGNFCGNNTTAPTTISTIRFRTLGDKTKALTDQTLYIDELWLTGAETMPDLTVAQLLYKGDTTVTPAPEPEPEPEPEPAVTGVSILTFADGAAVEYSSETAWIVPNSQNNSTLKIADGHGLNGKSAITLALTSDQTSSSDWWFIRLSDIPSTVATVNTGNFTDILSGAELSDLMLWFYIDATQLNEDIKLNMGLRAATDEAVNSGTYYYTQEKQYFVDGNGTVQGIYLAKNGGGAGLITSNARGRVTIEAGTACWIGIPVSRLGSGTAVTNLGDLRMAMTIGYDRETETVISPITEGSTISIGDIWLTRKDANGNWTAPSVS